MLTVFAPEGTGTFITTSVINGRTTEVVHQPRHFNGWLVIDLPRKMFVAQLQGANGKAFEDANWEAMKFLGEHQSADEISAFPGEHRAPFVAPVATEVAPPVMVKMIAPEGCSSFSHDGSTHKIGKDRTIEVEGHVAAILKSHGFQAV